MVEYIAAFEEGKTQFRKEDEKQETIIDYSQAIADYSKIVALDNEFVYAYYNRANVYAKSKQIDKALADYDTVIQQDPYFAEAYYNRGIVKIYQGDMKAAAVDLSKAGELGLKSAYNIIKRYCN